MLFGSAWPLDSIASSGMKSPAGSSDACWAGTPQGCSLLKLATRYHEIHRSTVLGLMTSCYCYELADPFAHSFPPGCVTICPAEACPRPNPSASPRKQNHLPRLNAKHLLELIIFLDFEESWVHVSCIQKSCCMHMIAYDIFTQPHFYLYVHTNTHTHTHTYIYIYSKHMSNIRITRSLKTTQYIERYRKYDHRISSASMIQLFPWVCWPSCACKDLATGQRRFSLPIVQWWCQSFWPWAGEANPQVYGMLRNKIEKKGQSSFVRWALWYPPPEATGFLSWGIAK